MAKPCRGIGGVAPLPYCAPAPDHATGLSFNYRVREHHSPPCAKGGQHGKAMQGGLAGWPRSHIALPRPIMQPGKMIQSASQSHRQRSLPPPFAQGRLLCCPAPDRPSFYGLARQRSMAVAARHRVMVYHTRSTTAPLVQRGDSMALPCRGDWRGGPAAILSPAV